MKCECNAKSLVQQVFCIFPTTYTMPSRHPPTSMRRGKGFTKAETTTLLKVIEEILPIDAEAWNEVHDVFNSKHTPHGVKGLKRKFNKLANKPVPTGNPNMPEDIRLAKSIKSKLFRCSGVTNISEEEEEDEEEEEEYVNDDNNMETVDANPPSQPLITDTEVQEILNNEEEANNSTITVEVSEEVTDTQAAVIAAPESSPTTTVQHGTPSLNQLAIAAAQSSLANQHVLQAGILHGASHKKQRMDTSQTESCMGDMLEIMKMDMMSQMQQ